MVNITTFQREALAAFRGKIVSWVGDGDGPGMFGDISDIEKKLKDLAEIGRYVIVDFTSTSHFDNFSAVYGRSDCLYVAWYENENRFMNGVSSHYLKFRPTRMMIYSDKDPRMNHIVIETSSIEPLSRGDDVLEVDTTGIQNIIDYGRELKPLKSGEQCHVFAVMCKPGRVVLHPKGSIIAREERECYFRDR